MAKKKHWMKEAFANAHGQFKAKAARAGKSIKAFAEEKKHAGGRLGAQANLALRGMEASHGKSRGDRWYGSKD